MAPIQVFVQTRRPHRSHGYYCAICPFSSGGNIILVPRAAILLASATDRELWQEPILQSAIRGLPVNCAAARFRERGAKMAGQRSIDIFHEALNFGLQLLGAGHRQLKEKQYEVLKVCSY